MHVWKHYALGVCYYPEQWEESLWRDDLRRMKAAGIGTVRVGEFCWAILEPDEGRFDFSLFDRFLSLCLEEGVQVIFGTPTATPPAWLTERYPEALNALPDGTLLRHGGRRHYNYNAPVYQKLCCRIVGKLGEHFGPHPAVVGWQIDNELNCETDLFCSQADDAAFRSSGPRCSRCPTVRARTASDTAARARILYSVCLRNTRARRLLWL